MADPASLVPSFDPTDYEPVTVFPADGSLVAKYSTGEIVPLTGKPVQYLNIEQGRSLKVFDNGRLLLEDKGAFYAQAPPTQDAPPEVQPSAEGGAQNPNTIPRAGQTPAPPAADAPAASADPKTVDTARSAVADAAKRESYSTVTTGNYSDPPRDGGTGLVVNVYQLTLYEFWNAPEDGQHYMETIELPYVQRITMQAPNAVARTRSMSGQIYAEHEGFVQRTFVIEGRSGPVWNNPNDSGAADALAISRFTTFRNFLEKYGQTSNTNKNALVRFKDTRLVLNCSFESESHFCDVVNFNYRRSTDTSTYSFEYSITLVTNGFASLGQWAPGSLTARPTKNFSNYLEEVAAVPATVAEETLRAAFDRASRFPRSSLLLALDFARRLREEQVTFEGSTNRLQNMSCSAIKDIRLAVSTLSALTDTSLFTAPFVTAKQRADTKATLLLSSFGLDIAHQFKGSSGIACPTPPWSDLYYDIVPYAVAGATLIAYLADQFGNNRGYDYTYQVINEKPWREGLKPIADTGPERPFAAVNYFLPQNGADAYSIAYNVFGDINLFWRIVDLNNFRDAYTRGDGTPLAPGSSVLVPSNAVSANKDEDVLGTDLLIVNGDLRLVGNNDVMRISGYANYTQNLFHRMQTPRGTNRVFPNHGLLPGIHSSSASTVPALIRNDVRRQVIQDHRTSEVTNISLTELGDKVQVDMLVKPIAGPQRSFKFNYNLNSQVTA